MMMKKRRLIVSAGPPGQRRHASSAALPKDETQSVMMGCFHERETITTKGRARHGLVTQAHHHGEDRDGDDDFDVQRTSLARPRVSVKVSRPKGRKGGFLSMHVAYTTRQLLDNAPPQRKMKAPLRKAPLKSTGCRRPPPSQSPHPWKST